MILPPPSSTLFPYTTLFRSSIEDGHETEMRVPPPSRREQSSPRDSSALDAKGERSQRRSSCADSDRKSTRLNSSHVATTYAVFCLKKKKKKLKKQNR